MLKKQKQFVSYFDSLNTELEKLHLSDDIFNSFDLKEWRNAILSTELLIPVVGPFSAGKSTLINSFLEQDILPVGITPETALATEIRYSTDERIEVVTKDNTCDRYSIDEMSQILESSQKYKCLKLYLNNSNVKDLSPLILVDMPGFESPLDLHNRAIMEYIHKGVYYIVLNSVEQGTFSRSMIRNLEEIKQYKRDFSFFLSKTNLRSKEDVAAVKKELEDLIDLHLAVKKDIITVDDNGRESFSTILKEINPEELFASLFIEPLKELSIDIISTLNTIILSLKSSKEENETAIKDLKAGINSIIHKRDSLIEEAKERYSDCKTDKIIEDVGRVLSSSIDDLANVAVNGGSSALEAELSELIRHTLITSVSLNIKEVSNSIVKDFSSILSLFTISTSPTVISDDFISRISDGAIKMLDSTHILLENSLEKLKDNKNFYKVITTVLAVTTSIVAPIIEIAIIFLPEVLDSVFKSYKHAKQIDTVKNSLFSTVIPQVKMKLRETLPEMMNQQITDLINQISDKYEGDISKKQHELAYAQQQKEQNIFEIEKEIELYESVLNAVKNLTYNALYKE